MTVHRTRLHRTARPASTAFEVPARPDTTEVTTRPRRSLAAALISRLSADRGDVPGWVLITLMTGAERHVASLLATGLRVFDRGWLRSA